MSEFNIPHIDDTVIINDQTLRVTGVGTWDDTDDEIGDNIVVLDITLVKIEVSKSGIPDAFREAFREET